MFKVIAFFSGAALMGLEIAGSRVLAPYFGSSVFVWGSLIGVLLAALSGGAYLGGRLADRVPDARALAVLLALAGLVILALPWVASGVNRWVFEARMGPRLGPLVASALMFLVPGVALGTVSPFLVRLSVSKVTEVGAVAGTIGALSTAGSVVGTLGTAFYLIPALGVRTILLVMGAGLLVMGGLAVVGRRLK
ncbi:MAG: fused MFS/spermidine synthase [bacterium]|nr:fused MFS/spermidine synthase [bacterium]